MCAAGKAPTSAIDKKARKATTPGTKWDRRVHPRTRAATARGWATSPDGTTHEYMANSGITPPECGDAGKAVLRMAMKH